MSSAENSIDTKPWTRPWWRPAEGQTGVFLYLVLLHLGALAGLALFPLPGLKVFLISVGLCAMGGMGTTVAYHRALAHKGLRLNPVVEQVLIFFAVFNGSGVPRRWVSNHRLHHAKADTEEDISSPRHGGFWWAHLFCLYQVPDAPPERWSPDLARLRYETWSRLQLPMLAVSFLAGGVYGWAGLVWIGPVRLLYALHMQCAVNSLLHMGPAKQGEDSSVNLWWMGPFQLFGWGENWHRNHHLDPSSARFGRSWRQTDVGWYTVLALEALGLAHDIKRGRPLAAGPS